jgi:hypothetical protein
MPLARTLAFHDGELAVCHQDGLDDVESICAKKADYWEEVIRRCEGNEDLRGKLVEVAYVPALRARVLLNLAPDAPGTFLVTVASDSLIVGGIHHLVSPEVAATARTMPAFAQRLKHYRQCWRCQTVDDAIVQYTQGQLIWNTQTNCCVAVVHGREDRRALRAS